MFERIPRIVLRLMVEVDEIGPARAVVDAVVSRTQDYARLCGSEVKPYWKIPEYYEGLLEFEPIGDANIAFERIISSLGAGWERHGSDTEPWAIWNWSPTVTFFSDIVKWANLKSFSKDIGC